MIKPDDEVRATDDCDPINSEVELFSFGEDTVSELESDD